MLGYKTIRKKHRSVSRGAGGSNVSYNHTEERRALMLPQEIKELPKDDMLIFYEGCKPIRAKKNWWFKTKRFKNSQRRPVVVPKFNDLGGAEPAQG
jgi:type IV secretion system protein VirD4